jgi:hypothetical protein
MKELRIPKTATPTRRGGASDVPHRWRSLSSGASLSFPDGAYGVDVQTDGNFVVYSCLRPAAVGDRYQRRQARLRESP